MNKQLATVLCGMLVWSAVGAVAADAAPARPPKKVGCSTQALRKALTKAGKAKTTLSLAPKCVYKIDRLGTNIAGLNAYGSGTIIEGNGATLRLNDGVDASVLKIAEGAKVELRDLTITGGTASGLTVGWPTGSTPSTVILRRVTITGNSASYHGGGAGITVRYGSATVYDSVIENNKSSDETSQSDGGGIWVGEFGKLTLAGTTTVRNNTIRGGKNVEAGGTKTNYWSGRGGGIYIEGGGSAVITDSATVTGNSAIAAARDPEIGVPDSGRGGGIYNQGKLTVRGHAAVTGNTASDPLGAGGGGIYNSGTADVYEWARVKDNKPNQCAGSTVSGCTN